MDYSTISFDAVWESDTNVAKEMRNKAIIYGGVFAFTSIALLISIIRTICTNPGNIPDHKEWDMSTDQSGTDEAGESISEAGTRATGNQQEQGAAQERFTNNIIDRNLKDPREIVHEDFKYLTTNAGPLIVSRQPQATTLSSRSQK